MQTLIKFDLQYILLPDKMETKSVNFQIEYYNHLITTLCSRTLLIKKWSRQSGLLVEFYVTDIWFLV
jgi:hypothetical protein